RTELKTLNQTRCQPPLPGPGADGWHRLLPTLFHYAERGRAQRRAGRLARGTIAGDESLDDQVGAEAGSTAADVEWPEPLPLEAVTVPPFPIAVLPPEAPASAQRRQPTHEQVRGRAGDSQSRQASVARARRGALPPQATRTVHGQHPKSGVFL